MLLANMTLPKLVFLMQSAPAPTTLVYKGEFDDITEGDIVVVELDAPIPVRCVSAVRARRKLLVHSITVG